MEKETESARRSLAERRQQLLDAAIEVMSDRGISGTTTRAITDEAGVPQGIFHYCFDSKSALLRALLERESERAMATPWELDPADKTIADALNAAIRAQLERVRAEPKHFLVLAELHMIARTDPSLAGLAQTDRGRVIEQIADVLARWLPDASPEELHEWATVVLAGMDGLTEGRLTSPDDRTIDAAARRFAHAIAAAIGKSRADHPATG
ncbi:TetR/AcrR family transcriptional regulator [Nocardia rhamnosiphila]|uniref:TetR/AcrR family transcriptional regulator n=1 Tax=Nocardia rhamnosiphila TaxID=426716 RepID=UPI0033FE7C09